MTSAPLWVAIGLTLGAPGFRTDNLDAEFAALRKNRVACAPLCVWYCLGRFGHDCSARDVVDRAPLAHDGMSLANLTQLCASFGLPCRAVAGRRSAVADLPEPSIVILDDRHCVVFDGLTGSDGVRVFEPVTGRAGVESLGWFMDHWTGEALVFDEVSHARRGPAIAIASVSSAVTILVGWLVFWRPKRRSLQE